MTHRHRPLTTCTHAGSLRGEPGFLIAFRYDRDTVEELKHRIPHTHREWRPNDAEWWVSEAYKEVLEDMFPNFKALAYLQGRMF